MDFLQLLLLTSIENTLKYCHRLYEELFFCESAVISVAPVRQETDDDLEDFFISELTNTQSGESDFDLMMDDDDDAYDLDDYPETICNIPKKPEDVLSMPIEELNLSIRTYNCLKRANMNTVGEIAVCEKEWFRNNVRNLGRKSMDEIEEKLIAINVVMSEKVKEPVEEKEPQQIAFDDLNSMIGLTNIKECMKDIAAHCTIRKLKSEICGIVKPIVPNMLFLGNPGTGKTTVARLVAKVFCELGLLNRGQLICVTRTDLVAGYTGQTALKTTEVFMSALDGVLFVDEAYSLYHKNDSDSAGDTFSREVIDTLTALMTEYAGRCCVIFAGYHDEMNFMLEHANPGLRDRFSFKMTFEDYSSEELLDIFLMKASEQKLVFSAECKDIITDTMNHLHKNRNRLFGNGRVVDNLLQDLVLCQERRLFTDYQPTKELSETELFTLTIDDFKKVTKPMLETASSRPVNRPVGFHYIADVA